MIHSRYKEEVGFETYWSQFLTPQIYNEVKWGIGLKLIHNSVVNDFKDIPDYLFTRDALKIARLAREALKAAGEAEGHISGECIMRVACQALKRGQI